MKYQLKYNDQPLLKVEILDIGPARACVRVNCYRNGLKDNDTEGFLKLIAKAAIEKKLADFGTQGEYGVFVTDMHEFEYEEFNENKLKIENE